MRTVAILVLLASYIFFVECTHKDHEVKTGKIFLLEKNGRKIPLIPGRDFIKIIEFPKTRQSENWTCGANCVQNICAYYGEDYREMDLVRMLKTTHDGTSVQQIIDFFRKATFKVDVKEHMTIAELKEYIDKDIPVILMIQAWVDKTSDYQEWSDGHFVVCIGYTKDELVFSDPSLYTDGYIPENKLLERWHDLDIGDKKYYQLGIAIYGKNPDFDLEKIEEIK